MRKKNGKKGERRERRLEKKKQSSWWSKKKQGPRVKRKKKERRKKRLSLQQTRLKMLGADSRAVHNGVATVHLHVIRSEMLEPLLAVVVTKERERGKEGEVG